MLEFVYGIKIIAIAVIVDLVWIVSLFCFIHDITTEDIKQFIKTVR